MKRPLVVLGACLALLLVGVGGLSWMALRLEAAERRARRQAAVEENVRLALWRMDSAVAPLLTREASRASWGREPGEHVILHFVLDEVGELASPDGAGRVEALRPILTRAALADRLGAAPPQLVMFGEGDGGAVPPAQRQSQIEYQMRSKSVTQAANAAFLDVEQRAEVLPGTPRVLWIAGELFLARRVGARIEGAWLDWAGLRAFLLREVADLFPRGALEPAAEPQRGTGERLLASLPARFVPGEAAGIVVAGGAGPLALVLGGAWAAVLLAAAALAVLLVGTLRLSERRATFVGAVTHELRTPLTTLRSYTEMLAGGMVREEKKQGYLETLSREAARLARLVDNVLAYARLERGKAPPPTAQDVGALLAESRPRLEERAAAAGMTVEIDAPAGLRAMADPGAVEQILFNLVDNACKYAGGGVVRVRAGEEQGRVVVRVADDGPGIGEEERRVLFEPFARPAERAAGSAPGVGLGLALCRRLARAMGGDLALEAGSGRGTVFALRLRAIRHVAPAVDG